MLEHASEQASLGLRLGGLGFRKAKALAAPAAFASMVAARFLVKRLLTFAIEACIASNDTL